MNYLDSRLPTEFWDKTTPEPNTGCWLWIRALSTNGYPKMSAQTYAHTHAFAACGELREGHQLTNKCGLKSCVNPLHWEALTRRAINRRHLSLPVKACKNGHEFTPENTYWRNGGGRLCLACSRARGLRDPDAEGKRRQKLTDKRERLKRRFGLSLEQFDAMRLAQDERCAICRDVFVATPHVDHCHDTGVVRALLCAGCNLGIGCLKDSPQRAQAAADYLRHHKKAMASRQSDVGESE